MKNKFTLTQLLSDLVPIEINEENEELWFRVRNFAFLNVIFLCLLIPYTIYHYYWGLSPIWQILMLFQIFIFINYYFYRFHRSIDITANLFFAAIWILLIFVNYYNGGIQSKNFIWLMLIPMISLVVLSRKQSILWTFLVIITFFGFYGFAVFGYNAPDIYPLESVKHLRIQNFIYFIVSTFMVTFTYHSDRDRIMSKYKMQNEMLRQNQHEINVKINAYMGLLRVICHDIGNPITAMTLAIPMVKPSDETGNRMIQKINNSISTINDIISHVRKMQLIESGKLEVEIVPINILVILNKLKENFADQIERKNIEIIIRMPKEEEIKVLAEPISLLNEVLGNLMSNAIKFSEVQSKIVIEVLRQKNSIVVRFKDHGIGIPEKILESMFDPQKSISRTGTAGEQGTGYGMSLVKLYIEKYGATLDVFSTPKESDSIDHGTEFIIKFHEA